VIKEMRARTGLAVWLVGTSPGTNSVANEAIRLETDRPAGIVLTATMLRRNKGNQVLAMVLDAIEMPVLITHHGKDACRVTPPNKVERLKKALKNARPVKVLIYGSGIKGKPCQAFHYHGFRGIESRVVADIMNWIKAPAP
jgi:pimeloyl-ACP methyl ester carboxylesterase